MRGDVNFRKCWSRIMIRKNWSGRGHGSSSFLNFRGKGAVLNIKPVYKLVDEKGRVLIPQNIRDAAKIQRGDIVRLGLSDGNVTVQKVDVIEAGVQSPEMVEAYVRAAIKSIPNDVRLELISELSALIQQKGE